MPKIFLVVPPGVEDITRLEINKVSPSLYRSIKNSGDLELECNWNELAKLNMVMRTPNRILLRLGSFHTTTFSELVSKARHIEWEKYLNLNSKIQIRTTCRKSKLYHSDAVSQRIHSAIEARLIGKIQLVKGEVSMDKSHQIQLIIVRLLNDEVTISIDTSGLPLHQRGYRKSSGKAPLRENLAAAMILASNWEPDFPLIDPFCGSGTIPIEAALIAGNNPPGINRNYSFEQWPISKELNLIELKKQLETQILPVQKNIFGSDRNLGAIQASTENCDRSGTSGQIIWSHQAVSAIKPDNSKGWIITNPPYGLRVKSNQDLRNLYAQFGNVIRDNFSGWRVLFLCSDVALAAQTKLNTKTILSFTNGGINVNAYYAEI
jgi:putative N6-adenine-specific DNA methylase